MGEIEVRQRITAPALDVFNFIADVTTHPRYAEFCKRIEITSAQRHGVGVTFTQLTDHGDGGLYEVRSRIARWEPGTHVSWVNTDAHGTPQVEVIYDLVQHGGEVEVIHRVIGPMLDDEALRQRSYDDNVVELANLKRLLERGDR
ncbi:MAG: SRPBCC family protein [Candidatus Tectomicrobia bacterium]|nr:SRPBCC family protein [Candidatus Tectomicrobia bacterium]